MSWHFVLHPVNSESQKIFDYNKKKSFAIKEDGCTQLRIGLEHKPARDHILLSIGSKNCDILIPPDQLKDMKTDETGLYCSFRIHFISGEILLQHDGPHDDIMLEEVGYQRRQLHPLYYGLRFTPPRTWLSRESDHVLYALHLGKALFYFRWADLKKPCDVNKIPSNIKDNRTLSYTKPGKDEIITYFTLNPPIQEGGANGVAVTRVVNTNTGDRLILKTPETIHGTDQTKVRNLFVKEAALMEKLNHPNIMRLFHVQHRESMYPHMFMEEFDGDLYDLWFNKDIHPPYLNNDSSFEDLFKQLLIGLQYLHKNGVIHRDIKPENIFLRKTLDEKNSVKIRFVLADFGLSKDLIVRKPASFSPLGTLDYMAPEIVNNWNRDQKIMDTKHGSKVTYNIYSPIVDVWSLAVTLLRLLGMGESNEYQKNKEGWDKWWAAIRSAADKIAPELKDMLEEDPQSRITVNECLERFFPTGKHEVHPLFKRLQKKEDEQKHELGQPRHPSQRQKLVESGTVIPPPIAKKPRALPLTLDTAATPDKTAGPSKTRHTAAPMKPTTASSQPVRTNNMEDHHRK